MNAGLKCREKYDVAQGTSKVVWFSETCAVDHVEVTGASVYLYHVWEI